VIEKPSNHKIFFDNFFTSYDLLKGLKDKGIGATGTVRDNRTRNCPLNDIKTFKKEIRGSHDYRNDGTVEFVRWNDNSVVTIGSNYLSHSRLGKAKQYSRKDKKKIDISQPHFRAPKGNPAMREYGGPAGTGGSGTNNSECGTGRESRKESAFPQNSRKFLIVLIIFKFRPKILI
jgi:hypothetical protein